MNNHVWENTATAFERAVTSRFAIECDLQMASDGTPMVFHDSVLNRVCNRSGEVRSLTAAQLAEFQIGGTSDTIPTFKRMLEQVNGRTGLVVELKRQAGADTENFARAVVDTLSDYRGPVVLMSFDHALLAALFNLDAPYPIGLTAFEIDEAHKRANQDALTMPIDFVSFRYTDLPSPFITEVRKRKLPLITWTIKDREGVEVSRRYADQITFEGFDPDALQQGCHGLDKGS